MSITEDDIRLEQLRRLRAQAVPPPQPDVIPPSQAMVPPDLSAYQQADALTRQAAPPPDPYAGMGTGKQMLMRGLAGAAGGAIHAQDPGGYTGYLDRQQQVERQREQDLLGRAKELRGEGYQRERDFAGDQRLQQARELQQQQFGSEQEYRSAQLSSEDAYRKAQIEKLRQPTQEFSFEHGTPGQPYGSFNKASGDFKQLGTEPVPPKEFAPINPEQERHNRAMEAASMLRAQKTGTGAGASDPEPGGYQAERAGRIIDSVNELKKQVGYSTVGVGTDLLSHIPIAGQSAANFRAQLETLKSNIITNELQQMRADSKTGGALGQVSDKESAFLSSALGSLGTIQDPATFSGQLDKIVASIERWQKAKGIPVGGNTPNAPAAGGQPSTMILNGKTLTLGADGKYH